MKTNVRRQRSGKWRIAFAGLVLGLAASAPVVAKQPDADLIAWREQRAASLTREDGWTALVALHWLDPKEATAIGSDRGNDVVVASASPRLGTLRHVAGRGWQLEPGPDAVLSIEGEPVAGTVTLLRDKTLASSGPETPTHVVAGPVRFTLIERDGRVGLRVWDSNALARTGFAGLRWYDADPSWRVVARWQAHEAGRTIDIANVVGMLEPMANPGAAVFERDGRQYRLEALQEPGSDALFFIFADRTSGRTTYGAGRYLYAALPDAAGHVVLDFNRAYNPPCAFTAFATCPLPPPENRLDLAVEAGERKYPGSDGH